MSVLQLFLVFCARYFVFFMYVIFFNLERNLNVLEMLNLGKQDWGILRENDSSLVREKITLRVLRERVEAEFSFTF